MDLFDKGCGACLACCCRLLLLLFLLLLLLLVLLLLFLLRLLLLVRLGTLVLLLLLRALLRSSLALAAAAAGVGLVPLLLRLPAPTYSKVAMAMNRSVPIHGDVYCIHLHAGIHYAHTPRPVEQVSGRIPAACGGYARAYNHSAHVCNSALSPFTPGPLFVPLGGFMLLL